MMRGEVLRQSSIRAVVGAAVVVVGSGLSAGCGEDEAADGDAGSVLEQTFSEGNRIESGRLNAGVEFTLATDDSEQAQSLGVRGPFDASERNSAPQFNLAVDYGPGDGADQELELIATADGGYMGFEGRSYAADPMVFRRFRQGAPFAGLEPARWFIDPLNEGAEEVDGVETLHISGTANSERLLPDLEQAARRLGLRPGDIEAPQGFFNEATIDLFTGVDDRILRRLDLHFAWNGELEGGEQFDSTLDVSLAIEDVDAAQEIEAPEKPNPISELMDRLPPELRGLGEFLSGGPE